MRLAQVEKGSVDVGTLGHARSCVACGAVVLQFWRETIVKLGTHGRGVRSCNAGGPNLASS